ncbi:MAG TPA: Mrp/NBP35 family ATP-binding protein [Acidimicrobiales bacterium]
MTEPGQVAPTVEHILGILRGVVDPELGSDIVDLGMVRDVVVDGHDVTVTVALTTAGCPLRADIQRGVRTRVGELPGVESVHIRWTELTQEQKAEAMAKARWNKAQQAPQTAIPSNTRVLMVASGKGGVGKSSITVNLAAGLAARGFTVGVLDADIWGYSVPRMLGVEGRLAGDPESKKIVPHTHQVPAGPVGPGGVLEVVSMGHLVDDEHTALMWRGLMLNRAVQHFLEDVRWGDLDYLVIDMPPGTGDVQMGLAQKLPRAEMLIVTTPATSAQAVAARAAVMGRKNYLRVAGVIENMSAFVTEDGRVYELFGSGGGEQLAATIGAPLLASIPIDSAVAHGGDHGEPVVLGSGPAADALRRLVERIATEVAPPVSMAGCSARILEAAAAALDAADAEGRAVTAVDSPSR